jgi:hypothetical protein
MLLSNYLTIYYNALIYKILICLRSRRFGAARLWLFLAAVATAHRVSPAPLPFMPRLVGPILWQAASRALPNKQLKPKSRSMRQSCRREIILEET